MGNLTVFNKGLSDQECQKKKKGEHPATSSFLGLLAAPGGCLQMAFSGSGCYLPYYNIVVPKVVIKS